MISVCIPCYNEERIIEKSYVVIKKEFRKIKQPYEIILFDDGSTDSTLEKLKSIQKKDKSVKVVTYFPNRGVGEAYKRMFDEAKGDYVVILDADMAVSPSHINKFYKAFSNTNLDVIIGSRFVGTKADYPFHRKIISRMYYFLYRILFGLKIKDIESGFAIFKRKAIKNLDLQRTGFESLLEIYLKIRDKGYKIKEFPVKFKHRKESKVRIIKHSIIAFIGTIILFIKWKKHLL